MYAIGVDLGGTKTAAGLVTADGKVVRHEAIPTKSSESSRAILEATAVLVAHLREQASEMGLASTYEREVVRVGVGSAGVINPETGAVVSATDAIRGWSGTELTAGLATRLGMERRSVRVLNDVHAHALGEAWVGAAAGAASALLVAFGTGAGGSFVVNGQPLMGHKFVAGHVGHMASPYAVEDGAPLRCVCGRFGHVEAIASGPALAAAYIRSGGDRDATALDVVHMANQGDSLALRAVTTSARAAGQAVGGLANILDPEIAVLAGGLAGAGPVWWEPMEEAMQSELLPVLAGKLRPVPTQLGEFSAVVGAARWAMETSRAPVERIDS
jgi:glucokinase